MASPDNVTHLEVSTCLTLQAFRTDSSKLLAALVPNEANLRAEKGDSVTNDPVISEATLRAIKQFASQEPTAILPAHDPDGPARLAVRQVYA